MDGLGQELGQEPVLGPSQNAADKLSFLVFAVGFAVPLKVLVAPKFLLHVFLAASAVPPSRHGSRLVYL